MTPWISTKDIAKGKEWFRELQGFLGGAKLCIICVTKENVRSPWLYYEAGAIASKVSESVLVCPYLVGVGTNMITDGPLAQWQCTTADRDDTLALIRSLNDALGRKKADEHLLEGNFLHRWPELEIVISDALSALAGDAAEFIATDADRLAGMNLMAEARAILLASSRSDGYLYVHSDNRRGFVVSAGKAALHSGHDGRERAVWTEALSSLERQKRIRKIGGIKYALTPSGWQAADAVRFASFDDLAELSKLSLPARELLRKASKDQSGTVNYVEDLSDTSISTNGREFAATGQMRDYAVYKDGFIQLCDLKLLRDQGAGTIFEVTGKGYEVANALEAT